jgi:hypothetical protein
MPKKILNNSKIKIKRFCFYFNDGIHNYKNNNKNNKIIQDDLSGNCFFNELIYKEIEIDNDKVISLNLRDENNLIFVNENNEVYVDLQLPD